MDAVFHEGELAVQERAGVRAQAARVGQSVRATVPPVAREFLAGQRMAVVCSAEAGAGGRVWASLLWGEPGFMHTPDERTLSIEARPAAGDPLAENLSAGTDVGVVVIEFETRRRMRFNGRVSRLGDRLIEVRAERVYSNCPKYIQARRPRAGAGGAAGESRRVARGDGLDAAQRSLIERADTFFIASFHAEAGADASHRGGRPGFVRVLDGRRLAWPDYAGNQMFNTLGNLAVNPRSGLLFVDFERGSTLQLTGRALIVWDEGRLAEFAGAERVLEFEVEQAVETAGAFPRGWTPPEYSPFNPAPA